MRRDEVEHFAGGVLGNIRRGAFQRRVAGVTAAGALLAGTGAYSEHYRGSFGNRLMWGPVAVTPLMVGAAVAGVLSARAARTALPAASLLYAAVGLVGFGMHLRGVSRKPGGWRLARYNLVMGPPVLAPALFVTVGGLGLLASLAGREGEDE